MFISVPANTARFLRTAFPSKAITNPSRVRLTPRPFQNQYTQKDFS